jgi:DNA mismatch repair protein MutS
VKVKEWQGSIVFLHEIGRGVAESSYGIHVAALAGLPKPVLRRAREILARLEKNEAKGAAARLAQELPLLALLEQEEEERVETDGQASNAEPVVAELRRLLDSVDPDTLAPKAALDLIYEMKAAARSC